MSPPRLHILYDKISFIATLNRKIIKNDRKLRVYGRQKSNTYVIFLIIRGDNAT